MLANIRCSLPPGCRSDPALCNGPTTEGPPRTAIPVRTSHLLAPRRLGSRAGRSRAEGPRLLPTRGRNKGADRWPRERTRAPRKGAPRSAASQPTPRSARSRWRAADQRLPRRHLHGKGRDSRVREASGQNAASTGGSDRLGGRDRDARSGRAATVSPARDLAFASMGKRRSAPRRTWLLAFVVAVAQSPLGKAAAGSRNTRQPSLARRRGDGPPACDGRDGRFRSPPLETLQRARPGVYATATVDCSSPVVAGPSHRSERPSRAQNASH
jgi:hypothetical protein